MNEAQRMAYLQAMDIDCLVSRQDLPGAKPTMFFAPTQIMKRHEELGAAVYQQRIAEATQAFFAEVDAWVHIEEHPFSEVADVYDTVLRGASPDRGMVVVSG